MVTDMSVDEVARQVGLARLSYFSGIFRRKFGVSHALQGDAGGATAGPRNLMA